jgi:hypothetical protein
VLLNARGEPVVADFGVAKFLAGEGLTCTFRDFLRNSMSDRC